MKELLLVNVISVGGYHTVNVHFYDNYEQKFVKDMKLSEVQLSDEELYYKMNELEKKYELHVFQSDEAEELVFT